MLYRLVGIHLVLEGYEAIVVPAWKKNKKNDNYYTMCKQGQLNKSRYNMRAVLRPTKLNM